jgi:hypothetical protein
MATSDVNYIDLDGVQRSITPSSPYQVVTIGELHDRRTLLEYNPPTIDSVSPSDIVMHAMSLVASNPPFLSESSITWLLAYLFHIKTDLLSVIQSGRRWPSLSLVVGDSIHSRGGFIYVTRLASAFDALQAITFGMIYFSDQGVSIKGSLLNCDSQRAKDIYDLVSFFDNKATKSRMTGAYVGGTIVKFTVPKGEEYVIDYRSERRTYPAGTSFDVEIERFHKTQNHWTHARSIVGLWERNGKPVEIPLVTIHSGFPVKFVPFSSRQIVERESISCSLYFPHDWIDAVYEIVDGFVVQIPVPVERH